MKFIDLVDIKIKAGNGGNGIVAFHRELYVPKGGPSGGDGGNGGNVILMGDENLNTLVHLKFQKEVQAEPGDNGRAKNCHGKNAPHFYVKVPVGTMVFNAKTDELIVDIDKHNKEFVIAKGGIGGRGNARFATSRNKAPTIFENGNLGEAIKIRCELKVLADVGLVGLPNAGKSTLLSKLTNSRPKIANYPFTTITPQLGVVLCNKEKSFVLADLPGLIEGASEDKGLGLSFLRHIERCRFLIHLVDMSGNYGTEDVIANFLAVRNELKQYANGIDKLPFVVVANKMDTGAIALENLKLFKTKFASENWNILDISALKSSKLVELKEIVMQQLDKIKLAAKDAIVETEAPEHVLYTYKAPEQEIIIEKPSDHIWKISGETIFRIYHKTPISSRDNILLFNKKLQDIGLFKQLEEKGMELGDTIKIFDLELVWE